MNEFMLNPTKIDRPRSVFPLHWNLSTTMQIGDIVPLMVKEVLPGDTFSIDMSSVLFGYSPFVSRVIGDLFLDVYAFFVPNRLVWDHWQQFCGENDIGAWTQKNTYTIPTQKWTLLRDVSPLGCLGDYMGLPLDEISSDDVEVDVSELPLRGYYRIYNEWFRNENTASPVPVIYGDGSQSSADLQYFRFPLKAARFPDYFSMALPQPQKGAAVEVPLGTTAPLITHNFKPVASGSSATSNGYWMGFNGSALGSISTGSSSIALNDGKQMDGLVVDLSKATAATINQWRLAFQTQKYLETLARGGSRYIESLKALFDVTNGDVRLQRTEYLGGKRIPLRFQEVVNTSVSGTGASALGQQVVKMSNGDVSSLFTKSFTEHGYLHVYGVIRYKHQYSQGLERHWCRRDFLDFYNPIFDNIGETPVYEKEIFCSGTARDDDVFGYQEAWAEYRYMPDQITGWLRPVVNGGLKSFTFGDNYSKAPTLNDFMDEVPDFVKRTVALNDSESPFAICDFLFSGKMARPMSVRSVPGLIDHH